MSVKRYEWVACDEHLCHCDVVESAEGDMVDYDDYAALEARCAELAAENSYLLPKAASELSNAWVLHKYLIGIQAAIMYLDNGNKKDAQEWLYGTIAGPGFEFPDEVEDIDAWAKHQMRGSISHPQALQIIKAETPATDAFLAEVRAQGVEAAIATAKNVVAQEFQYKDFETAQHVCSKFPESDLVGKVEMVEWLEDFSAQIRKGVQS